MSKIAEIGLPQEEIEKMLKNMLDINRKGRSAEFWAGLNAAVGRTDIRMDTILWCSEEAIRAGYGYDGRLISTIRDICLAREDVSDAEVWKHLDARPIYSFAHILFSRYCDESVVEGALKAGRKLPKEWIPQAFQGTGISEKVSAGRIKELLRSNWKDREIGICLSDGRDDVPAEWLLDGVNNNSSSDFFFKTTVRIAAKKGSIPLGKIKELLMSRDPRDRTTGIYLSEGRRDVPIDLILDAKPILLYGEEAWPRVFKGRDDLSVEEVKKWLKSEETEKQLCGIFAARGRQDIAVDQELLRLIYVKDHIVSREAAETCRVNGIKLPRVRDVNPEGEVYKKCLGGVIVKAMIPWEASIRMSCNQWLGLGAVAFACRSNKATITGVEGSYHGKNIGVSLHDAETVYQTGDLVEIEDFNYNHEESINGFHFFLNRRTAEEYYRY